MPNYINKYVYTGTSYAFVTIHHLYAHVSEIQKRKYESEAVLRIPRSRWGFICLVGCLHPGAWWPKRPMGKN